MATHYRTQGIILKTQDVGEADRVFTVFTKQFGKLRLRAVSERKITSKLRGGLELFYLSDIEFIQGYWNPTRFSGAVWNACVSCRDSRKSQTSYFTARSATKKSGIYFAKHAPCSTDLLWQAANSIFLLTISFGIFCILSATLLH
jgi:hypothetical protein